MVEAGFGLILEAFCCRNFVTPRHYLHEVEEGGNDNCE